MKNKKHLPLPYFLNYFILLFCLFCGYTPTEAQNSAQGLSLLEKMNLQNDNFNAIKAYADNYFSILDSNPNTTDSSELPYFNLLKKERKQYKRWEKFWATRYDDQGKPDQLLQSIYSIAFDPTLQICPGNNNSAQVNGWKQLGPFNSPTPVCPDPASAAIATGVGICGKIVPDPHDADKNKLYLCTPNSGLWLSNNLGNTWTCLTEKLRIPALGVNDVAIDPANANKLYIATAKGSYWDFYGGYGVGILRSADAGNTWQPTALSVNPQNQLYDAVKIHRLATVSSTVMLAVSPKKAWKTTDAWDSYTEIQSLLPGFDPLQGNLYDLIQDPDDASIIYLSSDQGQIWKSVNAGNAWTLISNLSLQNLDLFAELQKPGDFEDVVPQPGPAYKWKNWRLDTISQWEILTVNNNKKAGIKPINGSSEKQRRLRYSFTNQILLPNVPPKDLSQPLSPGTTYTLSFQCFIPANTRLIFKIFSAKINGSGNSEQVIYDSDAPGNNTVYGQQLNVSKQVLVSTEKEVFTLHIIAESNTQYNQADHLYIDNVEILQSNVPKRHVALEIADKPNTTMNQLYAMYLAGTLYVVDKLDNNSGSSYQWTNICQGINANNFFNAGRMVLRVNPLNENMIYMGGLRFLKSSDGGNTIDEQLSRETYDQSGKYLHDDIRYLWLRQASQSGNADEIYLANDGGFTRSANGGNTYEYRNQGLAVSQFYHLGGLEQQPNLLMLGAQDNGIFIYDNGNWKQACSIKADGGEVIIDNAYGSSGVMSCFGNDSYWRSNNQGYTFTQVNIGSAGAPDTYNLVKDPQNSQVYYKSSASSDGHILYKSSDKGNTWIALSDPIPFKGSAKDKAKIMALAVAPSNSSVLYYANSNRISGPGPVGNIEAIFQSTNGGSTWTDISSGLNALAWDNMITGICVDPAHSDRIWVSLAGRALSNASVYHREANGNWTDRSNGLPKMPVNRLVYQEGSNDILYAATDVGVFYWDNPSAEWKCFNKDLPVCVVTDLEINQCLGKLRISTYGKGLWETDLMPGPVTEINSPTVWSSPQQPAGDVLVKSGSSLLISGTVLMPANSRIRVEPGAILHINGGTVSNSCGMWHGIEVYGRPGLAQWPEANQGVLILNNATLSNARSAVATVKTNTDGSLDWAYCGGGIIKASNSVFLNNRKSVGMTSYHNPPRQGQSEANNRSYFERCTFKADKVLADPSYADPANARRLSAIEMVTLWDVKGVAFRGNVFENTLAAQPLLQAGDRIKGCGILAIDASMILEEAQLIPIGGGTPQLEPNRFKNLSLGVDYQSTGALNTSYIRGNVFENNERAITLQAGGYSRIYRNRFELNNNLEPSMGKPMGIFGMKHSAFTITENVFDYDRSGSPPQVYGVDINGTGASGGEVYKNHFIRQGFAQQTEQDNDALRIQCNQFERSLGHDLEINPNSGDKAYPYFGSCQQIIPKDPSNKFTYNPFPPLHIFKEDYPSELKYLVANNNSFPPVTGKVIPQNQINLNPCANPGSIVTQDCNTIVSESGGVLDVFDFRAGKSQAVQKTALINGGNSSALLALFTAQPPLSGADMTTALLAPGPYLSDVVLLAAIQQGTQLGEAQLLQILLANASLSPPVWQALQQRQPALSQAAMNALQAAQTGLSPRLTLEEEIRSLRVLSHNALYTAVGNYLYLAMLADTLAPWQDSAIALLEENGERQDLMQLAPTYISRGELEKAQNTLTALGTGDAELQDFAALMQIQAGWKQQQLNALQASAADRTAIQNLAAAEHPVAYLARGLHKLMAEVNYIYQPEEAEESSGAMQMLTGSQKVLSFAAAGSGIVAIYPNPAQDALTIAYRLQKENGLAKLELLDMAGHTVISQSLATLPLQGSIKINTSILAPGVYFCKATTDEKVLSIAKVIITR